MGYVVITTIQPPTASVLVTVKMAGRGGMRMLAVGDRKTPDVAWPDGAEFLPITGQLEMGGRLPSLLPENHYARKNLGYLLAMLRGAEVIFDTDDDNAPLPSWRRRDLMTLARPFRRPGWVNVYRWFSDEHIWPRGLPLESIRADHNAGGPGQPEMTRAPIQQGLANGSPDVDAIWRLALDKDIAFRDEDSVLLGPGVWCPFNSQSTWWYPDAYPLMYLPSFVSFRMTDIWRSFVAQRCLWAMGHGLVFHGPEVFQERNPHNLLRDFEQEIPGYLGNGKIRETLERLQLSDGSGHAGGNLHRCYEALVEEGFVPAKEMVLLEAWLGDLPPAASTGGVSRRDQ